ncbi:hypothetical protein [Halorhabdus amylolytica]|uniref:hypothetical protein n=1 Tax=Halorhabdus amylolytica TaxID=2559573 RepID=UPI0010AAA7D7|nr:hypothetical protein [Halorhabdus amylolytica]
MKSNNNFSRRELLEKGIATSALAALGFVGAVPASASEDSDEIKPLLESMEVKAIKRVDPSLECRPDDAVLIATGEDPSSASVQQDTSGHPAGAAIPTNHGTLTVVTTGGEHTAILDFDERVPEVEIDWPEGTTARLKSNENETTFQRSATKKETHRILRKISRNDLATADNVEVSIAPKEQEFYIHHMNAEDHEIERIRGHDPSIGKAHGRDNKGQRTQKPVQGGFQVLEEKTFAAGNDQISTASSCDCDKAMADLIFCVYQAGGCFTCFLGSPVPPVLVACLILVCAGGTGGVMLSFFGNLGCVPPSSRVSKGCLTDCVDEWV